MPTHDIDRIYAVKRKAQAGLLGIPGVHAVGLGAKYVGGERTLEPAILVYVEKKKPTADLSPDELIPTEIDGVKTDVVESARPRPLLDEARYRPLRGGIQIRSGGSLGSTGTLGWIAHTNTPVPKIVGVTNHHVVATPKLARATQLHIDKSIPGQPDTAGFTVTGFNTPRSLIVADFQSRRAGESVGHDRNFAFYATTAKDTPSTIAAGAAAAINFVGAPVTATAAGPSVTYVPPPGELMIDNVELYGPHGAYDWADLQGIVVGNEITLIGKASDDYGVFVNWNSGGIVPTRGVFTPVRKGSELAEIANAIAGAINGRALPGISATANGQKVIITGAQQVECDVSTDMRVGQPSDCFCSACSPCCQHRIGKVIDSRIDLDAALIELDGGFQYRAEIEEIGAIKGTRTYTLIDLLQPTPILVRKRGRTTGRTLGVLNDIDKVGLIADFDKENTPAKWILFQRFYTNVLQIISNTKTKIVEGGDSGSALVNDANEIIGILFGGGDTDAIATPIAEIAAAFDLSVETAAAVGEIKTVPATQGHAFSIVEREPLFVDRLREMERELTATPVGRELVEVGRRHAHEVLGLVNQNRRVGTVWRRNGGPDFVQTALTLAQTGETDLPRQINGRTLAECLRKMQEMLTRYGSAQLAADLRRYGPRIIELTKFDYQQLLLALQTTE